jgi:hypothetical protein
MAGDLESWWRNLPPVTKFLFSGMFTITLAANFGLISPMYLVLDFTSIYKKFEVWLSSCASDNTDLETDYSFLVPRRLGFRVPY